MARKIRITIELDEVEADYLDMWQPYPRPFNAFPEPSRADKVLLAVHAATVCYEALNSLNEDGDAAISRQWGWTPYSVQEARKWRQRIERRKRRTRAREDGPT